MMSLGLMGRQRTCTSTCPGSNAGTGAWRTTHSACAGFSRLYANTVTIVCVCGGLTMLGNVSDTSPYVTELLHQQYHLFWGAGLWGTGCTQFGNSPCFFTARIHARPHSCQHLLENLLFRQNGTEPDKHM